VDISDTSQKALSGFRIKNYILTRIDNDGNYEKFDPAKHGWRFINVRQCYVA